MCFYKLLFYDHRFSTFINQKPANLPRFGRFRVHSYDIRKCELGFVLRLLNMIIANRITCVWFLVDWMILGLVLKANYSNWLVWLCFWKEIMFRLLHTCFSLWFCFLWCGGKCCHSRLFSSELIWLYRLILECLHLLVESFYM